MSSPARSRASAEYMKTARLVSGTSEEEEESVLDPDDSGASTPLTSDPMTMMAYNLSETVYNLVHRRGAATENKHLEKTPTSLQRGDAGADADPRAGASVQPDAKTDASTPRTAAHTDAIPTTTTTTHGPSVSRAVSTQTQYLQLLHRASKWIHSYRVHLVFILGCVLGWAIHARISFVPCEPCHVCATCPNITQLHIELATRHSALPAHTYSPIELSKGRFRLVAAVLEEGLTPGSAPLCKSAIDEHMHYNHVFVRADAMQTHLVNPRLVRPADGSQVVVASVAREGKKTIGHVHTAVWIEYVCGRTGVTREELFTGVPAACIQFQLCRHGAAGKYGVLECAS